MTKDELISKLNFASYYFDKRDELKTRLDSLDETANEPEFLPEWCNENSILYACRYMAATVLVTALSFVSILFNPVYFLVALVLLMAKIDLQNLMAIFVLVLCSGGSGALYLLVVKGILMLNYKKRMHAYQQGQQQFDIESTRTEESVLTLQLQELEEKYHREIAPWYPPKYATSEIAVFMKEALEGDRVGNLQEAIEYYEYSKAMQL